MIISNTIIPHLLAHLTTQTATGVRDITTNEVNMKRNPFRNQTGYIN